MTLPERPGMLCEPDGSDVVEVSRRLCEAGVSDGLPVVPPTRSRIAEMLGHRDPERLLGVLPPLFREVSVQDVVVCAVLAGCRPDHLPALLAAVGALGAPEFNLLGVTTTTGSTAVGMVLHGPFAESVVANSGANCLGPGNPTNAALGRALALVLRAAAGAAPGIVDMSTMGQPAKYGCCFAEAAISALPPMLADRPGFGATSSAVTVFALSGTVEIVDTRSVDATGLLETLASAMPTPGTLNAEGNVLGSGHPVIVIPPEWAERFVKRGLSRSDIMKYLHNAGGLSLDRLAPAARGSVTDEVRDRGFIAASVTPQSILLIVAGGIGTKATYMPSWQGGSEPVTREIADR